MKLKNKNILITGASDGIGRSIAIALSKENVNLILLGRDEKKLKEVAEKCGNNAKTYSFDINDGEARNKNISEILSKTNIDVLINNAGMWHKVGDVSSIPESKISEVINTNLTSQILLTGECIASMIDRETIILNVISKSGYVPQLGQAAYGASKFGMRGFTDVLRIDTEGHPIRIGAVYQSGTDTRLFAKEGDTFSTKDFTNPDDLADVVVFMLSRPPKLWINEIHITY